MNTHARERKNPLRATKFAIKAGFPLENLFARRTAGKFVAHAPDFH
jgi:hypothetical protein